MTVIHIPAAERETRAKMVYNYILTALPGKGLTVEVEEDKPKRSGEQNAALFGLAYKTIQAETGHDIEELHTWACGEFFGWQTYEVLGQKKRRPVRTTTTDEAGKRKVMSKTEFAEFFALVQRKAAEFGIFVPDPDPRWRELE